MKKKILIAISIIVVVFIPFSIMAQNSIEHDYEVVDFRNGIVGIKCVHCGDYYRTSIEGYINIKKSDDWYNSALDVNKDGIINAKDYAKFYNEYPLPTTTIKPTTTKKATTSTTKKTTTSLSQQTTDKDGYNNGVIAP